MAINLKAITNCAGYQQITGLDEVKGLTVPATTPDGLAFKPNFALITPEGQAVRWRDDGTAPSASVGMPLAAGVTLQYDGDLSKIKFIEQTSGAILNISYYA